MKTKAPEVKKMDIAKNFNIPANALNILKSLLKIEYGKQYIETISDIVKMIGLLARITFQKNLGIEMVYIRSFIPLFPSILKSIYQSKDQNFVNNFLRTIGIFANNASANHIRSFSFYKDIVEFKLIQESIDIIKHF
jgi:fused-like protein